jgi:hypothetical protein
MYFDTKSYFKSNRNHTAKQTLSFQVHDSYSRQMRVEVQLFGISQKKVACKHGGLRRLAG